MGAPVFPPEIFDQILGNIWLTPGVGLHEEEEADLEWPQMTRSQAFATIRDCLRVSKTFYALARAHLFTDVVVTVRVLERHSESAKALLGFIDKEPDIALRIRSVTLVLRGPELGFDPNPDACFKDEYAAQFLKTLPHLRLLRMTHQYNGRSYPDVGINYGVLDSFNDALRSAIYHLQRHPHLETLEVGSHFRFPWIVLEHWPMLKSLVLHFAAARASSYPTHAFDLLDWEDANPTHKLERFEAGLMFDFHVVGYWSERMEKCTLFDGLREYRAILDPFNDEQACVLDILKKASRTLETLHLLHRGLFAFLPDDWQSGPSPMHDYPGIFFQSLKELHIDALVTDAPLSMENSWVRIDSVLPLLTDLASAPKLERFSFRFFSRFTGTSPGFASAYEKDFEQADAQIWKRIDEALADRPAETLKNVEIIMRIVGGKDVKGPIPGRVADIVKQGKPRLLLPRLASRETVQVIFRTEGQITSNSNQE